MMAAHRPLGASGSASCARKVNPTVPLSAKAASTRREYPAAWAAPDTTWKMKQPRSGHENVIRMRKESEGSSLW